MFQNAGRRCTIGEKLGTIFLCGNSKTDCILRHCYWTISDKAIKSQARNMQYVVRPEDNRVAF